MLAIYAPGTVYREFLWTTTPPKVKRYVILAENTDSVLIALINSEININFLNTQELRDLQLKLSADGRSYLDHDSYLNCSQVYEIEKVSLLTRLKADRNMYTGTMSRGDFERAIRLVVSAGTINARIKRSYALVSVKIPESK